MTAVFGSAVTLTATVTPATATGNVTFYDGATVLGTSQLASGIASFTTKFLAAGSRSLKARYEGDANDAAAGSTPVPITVSTLANVGFLQAASIAPGIGATSLVSADFNGDGKADLAIANSTTYSVVVFLGNGDGTFQSPHSYLIAGNPAGMATGDFNGDGKTDLVVANNLYDVSVLLGNGDGTFQSAVTYGNYDAGGESVVVADINGDGKPDLAVATGLGPVFLIGNGDGTFQTASTVAVAVDAQTIAAGDFNGDGIADVVVLGDGCYILLGKGDGSFETAMKFSSEQIAFNVVVGDFNDDGKQDLAIMDSPAIGFNVFLGKGDGTFNAAVSYQPGGSDQLNGMASGDFNGDGITDIIVGDPVGNKVWLFPGNPGGTFQAAVPYAGGSFPVRLLVADFNGDGIADFATTSGVFLGRAPYTTTTLVSSLSPSNYGQAVTLTAAVSPAAATGSVTFYDGTTILGSASLAGGQATLTTSLTASGFRSLTAHYSGDSGHPGSTSLVLIQKVIALPSNGFQAGVLYAAGSSPTHIAEGDFNGDGIADLVVVNPGANNVDVLLGNGDGSFRAPVSYGAGTSPDFVTVGDLNGDGKPDLAVGDSGTNNLNILPGNGDGTFQAAIAYATGGPASSIAIGDFNGDGKADLAVAVGNGVNILPGVGDGTFGAEVNYNGGSQPWALVTGDFNNDGKTDLAVANPAAGNVCILLGNGDGSFQNPVSYAAGSQPYAIAAGDFNHDGFIDLAVVDLGDGSVDVLLGKTGGTFLTAVNYAAGAGARSIAVEDFNGDGYPDLVIADDFSGGAVSVLFGSGNGVFQPAVNYLLSGAPDSVVIGDFTGDGRVDCAITIPGSNGVSILLSQVPPPTTTTLTSSLNPSGYGQSVTLTATISLPTATGTVAFYDSGTMLGIAPVLSGTATLKTNQLASGIGSLNAYYSGGTGLLSTSAILHQTVNALPEAGLGLAVPYNYGSPFAVGDFNGDGKPDLVTLANASVNILLNRGNGVFGAPVNYSAYYQPTGVVTGDFNGDGNVDLAVSSSAAGTISILLGNGDGSFRAPATFNVGYNVQSVAVGDLNGDGKADLVAGFAFATTGSGISVYLGNGDGTFQTAVNYLPGVAAWSVALGDFNGDGKADLALANGVGGLIVLIGAGNGSFLPAVTYGTGSGPRSVAVGDLNGDGIADVITANYYGNTVSILLGKGDGTFQTASGVGAGNYPASVALGDFNGDGKPDLVVADSNFNNASNGNTVVVLFGRGDGTISGSTKIGVEANPSLVVVGDFNGDSLTDLAVAAGPGVEILKGTPLRGTTSANVGLASSANPSTYGQNLIITATVAPSAATGRVAFYDAGALLESVPMAGGVATMQTSLLSSGSHSLQVLYSGDTTYQAATSAVLTQTVNPVTAQGFAAGPSYSVVNGATSIAAGDFNGDGRPDIAVGSPTGVSVLVAGGGATFLPAVNYVITGGVIAVATGDFNGDGKLDLITLDNVLFGNGDGTFQSPISFQTPAGWNAGNQTKLFVADFNGDGFADVLLTDAGQNNWAILPGNGDGTFASTTYTGTGAVGLGDFNGDGKPDIILSETSLAGQLSLVILLGNGDGTFTAAAAGYVLGASSSTSLAPGVANVTAGDFNGDGKLDIAVTVYIYNNAQSSELVVLAGNGDGTFHPASQYAVPGLAGSLVTADFNGDGKLDIAVGGNGGISIYYGQGNGNFQAVYPFAAPTSVFATGDFNGDGRVDLIAAGGGQMDVYFGLVPLIGATTTLTASPNPSVYYQTVTLTATVSRGATGSVDFYQGVTLLGTSAISGGIAVFNTSSLTSWGGAVKAVYGGDAIHSVSSSAALVENIAPVAVSRLAAVPGYAVGNLPQGVAIGDLNGDGKNDVVVANYNGGGVSVLLGNGDGTFQPAVNYATGRFYSITVRDVNGDGKPDLVTGGDKVSVFLGNGDGTFQSPAILAPLTSSAFQATSLVTGDFNGDGKFDVAFVEYYSGAIGVLLGKGDGTFRPVVNYYAAASAESVTAGDFNSDGKTDLAVASYSGNNVSILTGIGDGTFETPVNYPAGTNPHSIAAGDFNADGYPDLAVANTGSNNVSILLGRADGTFSSAVSYPTGKQPVSIALGDFNGDGRIDLIIANQLDGTVSVLAGSGSGTFTTAGTYASGNYPVFVATGDLNGDGATDAAVADYSGNTVSILLGVIPGPAYQLNTAVSSGNSGTIAINPAAAGNDYVFGSTLCLTASPAPGQIFAGWSGTTLNAAGCLTLTANASVTANFTANPISASSALRFVPVAPCRLADTRNPNGPLGAPAIGGGNPRSFTIPGTCNIPPTALAYSLNLTVVPHGTLGYITLWPTGQSQPVVSTLNSLDGRIKSNAAIVPAGTGGAVSVFATDTTDAILDINGYFDSYTDTSALQFYPLTPCRVADTRNSTGSLGGPSLLASQARSFPILSSACNIPGNALAYSLNFTAIPQGPLGYLTVWPDGQSQPVASTLNAPTGVITANAAIVPAGNGGAIELFVTDNSDMAIDINGYFAAPASGGLSLYNLTPCRIEDTRLPAGTPAFTGTVTETTTGVACGVPPEARSLVLNATVVPSGGLGYLSLWANGVSQPVVSTLNALDGSLTSNMAVVPTTNGLVNTYAAGPGAAYLILDISGYFAP